MILDREKAIEMSQIYRSRYREMSKSADPEDRANAEAPRLAGLIWELLGQDLAERRGAQVAALHSTFVGGAGFGPGAPAAGSEQIDVADYPARLAELWQRYLATFEILDDGAITIVGEIQAATKPQLLEESLRDHVYQRGIDHYVVEMKKLLRIEDEDAIPAGIQGSGSAPEPPSFIYEPTLSRGPQGGHAQPTTQPGPVESPAMEPARSGRSRAVAQGVGS